MKAAASSDFQPMTGASDSTGILSVARRRSPYLKNASTNARRGRGRVLLFHPIEQMVRNALHQKRHLVGKQCRDRFKVFREEIHVLYLGQFSASFVRRLFTEEIPELGQSSVHAILNSFRKVHELMLLPAEEGIRLPLSYHEVFKEFQLGPWHPGAEIWLKNQYGLPTEIGQQSLSSKNSPESPASDLAVITAQADLLHLVRRLWAEGLPADLIQDALHSAKATVDCAPDLREKINQPQMPPGAKSIDWQSSGPCSPLHGPEMVSNSATSDLELPSSQKKKIRPGFEKIREAAEQGAGAVSYIFE